MAETMSEFNAIVRLNAFYLNPLFLEFINYSEKKLVRRVSGLFGIGSQDSVSGILVDGSVLEQFEFRIGDTFARHNLHIDLNPFPWMRHLLVRFGRIGIFFLDCYEPFAFQYPPQGLNTSGISSLSEFAPELHHSKLGVSSPHIMNELQLFRCMLIRVVIRAM